MGMLSIYGLVHFFFPSVLDIIFAKIQWGRELEIKKVEKKKELGFMKYHILHTPQGHTLPCEWDWNIPAAEQRSGVSNTIFYSEKIEYLEFLDWQAKINEGECLKQRKKVEALA